MSIIFSKIESLIAYIAEGGENTLIKQLYHLEKQTKKITLLNHLSDYDKIEAKRMLS
jgi:hypothetical protein